MRQLLSVLFSTLQGGVRGGLLLLALFASVSAIYASDMQVDGIWYDFDNSTMTASVTYRGYNYDSYVGEYSGAVVIPETVTYNSTTYSVTSIGEAAFFGCSSLTSVNIPNGVTSIGNSAFERCYSLTSITLLNSVMSIGDYAFYNCSSLTSIIIPNSVTSIGDWAFDGCDALPVENNLRYADTYLVGAVDKTLSTYSIKEGTKWIGDYAFYNCSSLASITIPNSVTNIGNQAFYGTGIYSNESNWENGVLYISNFLIKAKESISGAYEVNENTRLIAPSAFSNCSALTSITIPNSVTSIGNSTFNGCESLTSITIPNSVTSIGNSTFEGCSSLTSITIPNSVTSIGNSAFNGCSHLTSIDIPNSVTSIGSSAFYRCKFLSSITIPNGVTSIGKDAFAETPWYDNLPDGLVYFGKVLYKYKGTMPANTNINVKDETICISGGAFSGCSGLVSIIIPNSITSIAGSTFSGCSSLTSITIPENVTSIGGDAFYGCSSLTSITIPKNVTSIGDDAFYGCSSLTSITIPENVTSIGDNAFSLCSSLTSIVWNAKKCSFGRWASDAPFYAVASQIISFSFGDSVATIPSYLCSNMSSLTSVTISENVTSIESDAFDGCSALTSITIPKNVTSIGSAFGRCSSLTTIHWNVKNYNTSCTVFKDLASQIISFTFGDSVEYIPENICSGLDSLTNVTIGKNVLNIGSKAFYDCDKLTKTNYTGDIAGWCNIKFGDSYANPISYSHNFYINGDEVRDVIIPNTIDSIHNNAFTNCVSLASVIIPNSVTTIGSKAFYDCDSLSYVSIGSGVTSIGGYAFYDCPLTSIIIPNSVTSIGNFAFYSCDSLKMVAIGKSVTSIGDRAFRDCPIDTVYSRNPTPPSISTGSYATFFESKPICIIPCGCSSSYEKSDWKNYMSKFITGNVYFLNTIVSNPLAGRVEILQDPQCDYGATFQAIPNVGYEFVQWSDGVTDALRTLDLTQDTTLIAEFRQLFDGKCGDNLYWKHYDDKIIIHGEGAMYDYAADSVPWYQFRDIVKTVEVFDGATSIGNNAFALCKNLNTLTLAGTIENIGENAFGGCRMLFDIYCYVLFPPIASETSFVNYNAYLYILCDYQRYYAVDMVFGNFRNMQCIGTQSTPTDSMVITPSYNDVTITWPTVANAGSYTLTINKDGEAFCTLIFNAAGQLTGIAFAPSRNGQRHAPAATQAANGFTFTVTGLEEGTDYSYNLVIKDNSGKTLQTYSGEFRTQSTNDRTVTVEYDAIQGQVTGAGIYLVGDTVTLTAIPNDGYRFVRWSNEVEDNPYTFVISENMTLSAEFESVIPSSVENTHTQSPMTNCKKIIRDGQLLILRDGKTYNAMGVLVE